MSYLLDSNIVSELRKRQRADAGVRGWLMSVDDFDLYLSVLTVGEIRRGIESILRRDRPRALVLNRWFRALVVDYETRLLPVDREIAEEWGQMNVTSTLPAVEGLLAATARVHGLTFVTRNTRDVARTGVPCLNPFEPR